MVWQRFAKSPRVACAGSTPVASAKVFGGEIERQHWWLSAQLAHRRKNPGTCSSAESERDSAKVEVTRSNRARSTNQQILRSGRAGKARVSETRLRRFESYLRSQFEKFDAEYTGVVKPPGTDS